MDHTSKQVFIMSGTHWDREWYRPHQGFRYKLVKVLTQIIETLEKYPDYGTFTLDGQTLPLKDYLEICPEMCPRIEKLISDKRLIIGPWYCMPDEFLVSGESIITNLLKGQSMCREFGCEPWKYGYICDIFGHSAQTVQIFNGFGIHAGLICRGANESTCPAHFVWESPDGSRCITNKTPDYMLYGDLLFSMILPMKNCKTDEEKDEIVKNQMEKEFARTKTPYILLMDALDHMPAHIELMDIKERIIRLFPGTQVVIGDPLDMAKGLEKYESRLPVKCGQLTETAIHDTRAQRRITHTLSSRYDIKKENDICQTKIEKLLNPIMVYSSYYGQTINENFLSVAKDYLLKNHPHDSICGCSIDAVHSDMLCRFSQIKAISYELLCDVFFNINKKESTDDSSEEILIRLFNPLPYNRHEVVTVNIPFPSNYSHKFADEPYFFEKKNAFRIKNAKNEDIPYNLLEITENSISHKHEDDYYHGDLYTVSFEANLSPMGETNYLVYFPKKEANATRYLTKMSTGFNEAENEYLKLHINNDGTICITDKLTGHVSDGLLYYMDDGEIGDGWNHVNPVNDISLCSKGSNCVISIINDGPCQCIFGVKNYFTIPKRMDIKKRRTRGFLRSEDTTILEIFSKIKLSKGAKFVEVETSVSNNAEDHRLRLILPTNAVGNTFFSSQFFAIVNQSVGRDSSTDDYNEFEPYEKPSQGIVGKNDKDKLGVALVSAYGLHECACFCDNSLAVTLFRCFDKTVYTNGETDGQLQGTITFKYAVVPMSKNVEYGDLQKIQDVLQTGVETSFISGFVGEIPKENSFMELTGDKNLCFSTMKKCEFNDNIVVRVYNLGGATAKGNIKTVFGIKSVYSSRLDETVEDRLLHNDFDFNIEVKPYKIQTYIIEKK